MTTRTNDPDTVGPGSGAEFPADWADRLDRALDAVRGLYGQLDALSLRQTRLIQDDALDELLELLADRQRVIDDLNDAIRGVSPYAARWDELMPRLAEPKRTAVERSMEGIRRMAASVDRRDSADHAALRDRRKAIADELAGMGRARSAMQAYKDGSGHTPRFQDREG